MFNLVLDPCIKLCSVKIPSTRYQKNNALEIRHYKEVKWKQVHKEQTNTISELNLIFGSTCMAGTLRDGVVLASQLTDVQEQLCSTRWNKDVLVLFHA